MRSAAAEKEPTGKKEWRQLPLANSISLSHGLMRAHCACAAPMAKVFCTEFASHPRCALH
jgi:hypothetical protein